jgi:hypothetical protein
VHGKRTSKREDRDAYGNRLNALAASLKTVGLRLAEAAR